MGRAVKVRLDQLRHPVTVKPGEVLNMLEEELVRDSEEEGSLEESTTDLSSSIQEFIEEIQHELFS